MPKIGPWSRRKPLISWQKLGTEALNNYRKNSPRRLQLPSKRPVHEVGEHGPHEEAYDCQAKQTKATGAWQKKKEEGIPARIQCQVARGAFHDVDGREQCSVALGQGRSICDESPRLVERDSVDSFLSFVGHVGYPTATSGAERRGIQLPAAPVGA